MATVGHATLNDLPVTLNCNIGDAQKILQALGQMPHNMVRALIDDLTAQIQHQIQQNVAASQAMNQQQPPDPSGTAVATANGNSPATPATPAPAQG